MLDQDEENQSEEAEDDPEAKIQLLITQIN